MITKVVLLAGGKGTRLAPLTDDLPKPLLPVNGIPTLSHILRALERLGVRRVTLAVGHKKEAIMQHYGCIFRTMRIDYSEEKTPLGTAGAVKAAVTPLGPAKDIYGDALPGEGDVLVVSGDALFEGDLAAMIRAHINSGADLTIAAKRLDDVSGYGVITGSPSRIEDFIEKPDPEDTPSHTVNIGIYLFSSRLLAEIPDGPYDFGRELFPSLLRKGYRLAYYLYDDYWCDVGTPESYLAANLRLSQGETVIGSKCRIDGSALLSQSVLYDGVTVEKGASVITSVVASGAVIGEGVRLIACLVGEGCTVRESPPENSALFLSDGRLTVTPLTLPIVRIGEAKPIF